jgi:16S rRNA (guanine966-N2)-methyltransferase
MRVIAGTARSLPLVTPKGEGTRPTTDRIKETLFNIIQTYVPGSVFADVYAGSGGIGIEAISRGATHAYFIDNSREALGCIKDNINFTKFSDKSTIISADAQVGVLEIPVECDIIFMDPPYELHSEASVLSALTHSRALGEDTLIIIEADVNRDFSFVEDLGFTVVREKNYKTNKHVFIKKENQ